ncbi:MAG: pyridoxamine 5'-phosphate oxidase family protein [Tannerellaceae bacterium]|nr:pyridoxamine 5'-phosphate oxidase family protein [Tannerellaceae bacterium]
MREVRRQDRLLDETDSRRLLETGEYGFLAMVNTDGGGYGIPVSFVYEEPGRIYFHCAPQGHKLDNIKTDNRVTFTVVGKTEVLPAQFSTLYESVMTFGKLALVEDDEEKHRALILISQKYSPEYMDIAKKYITASFARTTLLRLDIERVSGKCKR